MRFRGMPGPSRVAPLDRRRHAMRDRDFADHVLRLAAALPPDERALLDAVFARGLTLSALAALHHQRPQLVRRRINRLVARVLAPPFAFVVHRRRELSRLERAVAAECFIRGRSVRAASRALGLSLHAVRRTHDILLTLCERQAEDHALWLDAHTESERCLAAV